MHEITRRLLGVDRDETVVGVTIHDDETHDIGQIQTIHGDKPDGDNHTAKHVGPHDRRGGAHANHTQTNYILSINVADIAAMSSSRLRVEQTMTDVMFDAMDENDRIVILPCGHTFTHHASIDGGVDQQRVRNVEIRADTMRLPQM